MKRFSAMIVSGMLVGVFCLTAFAQPAGKGIVDNACSKCHGIQKVEKAKKNASEWEATLDKMIKKGANIKSEDRKIVLEYLNTLNEVR